jgi:hypothetical protein
MATPCRKQDPSALEKLAPHVDYECDAFGATQREIRSWADFAQDDEDSVRRAAVYEMWLVHLRNLVAFFRTKQDQGDEVLACHFMDDPAQWARDRESELQLSAAERERVERINHLVTHITYERPRMESDFSRLDHEMVMKRLRIFYAQLPARHKARFPKLAALVT